MPPGKLLDGDALTRFWACAEWEDRLSVDESYEYRVIVAWRVTRAIATIKGLLGPEETLHNAMRLLDEHGNDQWHARTAAEQKGDETFPAAIKGVVLEPVPLPVMPSRDDPEALNRFVLATQAIIRQLGLTGPGTYGLDDPEQLMRLWPSTLGIVQFERDLVEVVAALVVKQSSLEVLKTMADTFKLKTNEAMVLIKMARGMIETIYGGTMIEQDRALLIGRLEEIAVRARFAHDIRSEISALKLIAQAQGITSIDPEEEHEEFKSTHRAVTAKIAAKRLPYGSPQT